jgi:hypothetical protein
MTQLKSNVWRVYCANRFLILAISAFLLLGGVYLALGEGVGTPTVAQAHDCQGEDPLRECGTCSVGKHDHRYSSRINPDTPFRQLTIYCKTNGDDGGKIREP